jgi:transcriptional regulator with XRE-family HTH domain
MEFPQWLFHKYLAWQSEVGQRKSLTAFAAYVGVSQPQMTAYLKGDYLPKGENLGKMAAVLGVEVYDVMGMPRPLERGSEILDDPEMVEFIKTIHAMPDDLVGPMLDFAADLLLVLYQIPDPERRKKVMKRLINIESLDGEEVGGVGKGRKNPVFKKKPGWGKDRLKP